MPRLLLWWVKTAEGLVVSKRMRQHWEQDQLGWLVVLHILAYDDVAMCLSEAVVTVSALPEVACIG